MSNIHEDELDHNQANQNMHNATSVWQQETFSRRKCWHNPRPDESSNEYRAKLDSLCTHKNHDPYPIGGGLALL